MTQCRLNNILLLHCHKEMTDVIDLTAIAQDFIAAIERRKTYFWRIFVIHTHVHVKNENNILHARVLAQSFTCTCTCTL